MLHARNKQNGVMSHAGSKYALLPSYNLFNIGIPVPSKLFGCIRSQFSLNKMADKYEQTGEPDEIIKLPFHLSGDKTVKKYKHHFSIRLDDNSFNMNE